MGPTGDDGTMNVEILLLLKYLRSLEMILFNSEINLILTSSGNRFISSNAVAIQATTFAITDTKLYAPIVNFINSR